MRDHIKLPISPLVEHVESFRIQEMKTREVRTVSILERDFNFACYEFFFLVIFIF
jgi:hypothetical protein